MVWLALFACVVAYTLVVLAAWPRRRRLMLPVMLAACGVFYALLWEHPGPAAMVVTMAVAGATLRAFELSRTLPTEASRAEFLRVWLFVQRHPQDAPRPAPALAPGWRATRGAALIAVSAGLVVLGSQVEPWRIHPYLDDLWTAAELVCLGIGQSELISAVAARVGLRELLLSVEAFHPGLAWSRSLRHFWSQRWNLPTSGALRRGVFDAVGGRRRLATALLATFVVSGLLHAPPLLVAGDAAQRRSWALIAVGTQAFFVLHGLMCLAEGALARGRRRWLGRPLLYATFLLTLPLYPAPVFLAFGLHGRPVETATPLVLLRAVGAL